MSADPEVAHKQIVSLRAAENSSGAMGMEDDRKRAGNLGWPDHADGDLPVRPSRDRGVFDVDVGLLDDRSLHAFEDFPGLVRAELVDERWLRDRVGELLRGLCS